MKAIEISKLTKSYDGNYKAINDISFTIPRGEIFGFLGPNGSGKTTTVRILNGILAPTSGEIKLLDRKLSDNPVEIHRKCGVMTETAACYESLTGEENLTFFGKLHGIEEKELSKRVETLLKSLELYEDRNKKVGNYSTGMRKRISLAIALVHSPEILFLDEPTSGLDPENAVKVTKLIKKLAEEKEVTVFLCTHQLKYAEDICTLYGFINKGEMLGFGSFEDLVKMKNIGTYINIRGEKIPKEEFILEKGIYKKRINSDEEASKVIYDLLKSGAKVFEAYQSSCTLEELYFNYMRGENHE